MMNSFQYKVYSVNSEFSIYENSYKIYNDIETMKGIKDFDEIVNFIEINYGKLNDLIVKDCNDDIKLLIGRTENIVEVFALQKSEMIMGQRWKLVFKKADK